MTPPAPDAGGASAGVAIQVPTKIPQAEMEGKTKAFKKWRALGRCCASLVVLSKHCSMVIYCIYGFTGGSTDCHAASKTNAIMECIFHENTAQGNPPCLIVGDINCLTTDLTFMRHLLGSANYVDVGATESSWCAEPNAPTCKATNIETETRRDYIFAHPLVVPLLHRFSIGNDDELLVHYPLTLTLKLTDASIKALQAGKCPLLDSLKPEAIEKKNDWKKLVAECIDDVARYSENYDELDTTQQYD